MDDGKGIRLVADAGVRIYCSPRCFSSAAAAAEPFSAAPRNQRTASSSLFSTPLPARYFLSRFFMPVGLPALAALRNQEKAFSFLFATPLLFSYCTPKFFIA